MTVVAVVPVRSVADKEEVKQAVLDHSDCRIVLVQDEYSTLVAKDNLGNAVRLVQR